MSAPFDDQQLHDREMAALGGVHQRILVALDREIHVRAAIDQHLHLIEPAAARGVDQRAAVAFDDAVGIRALIEQ